METDGDFVETERIEAKQAFDRILEKIAARDDGQRHWNEGRNEIYNTIIPGYSSLWATSQHPNSFLRAMTSKEREVSIAATLDFAKVAGYTALLYHFLK